MSDKLKLKACPFCGDDNAYFSEIASVTGKSMFVVNCQGCVVSTSVPMWAKEFASEVWNRRVNEGDKQL